MRASEANLTFPILVFEGDGGEYDAIEDPAKLYSTVSFRPMPPRPLNGEIIDSENRRFRMHSYVDYRRSGSRWRIWLENLGLEPVRYEYDLEIEPLESIPFEEILRRVAGEEARLETLWIAEGGGPDSETFKRRLQQCRSIAEIIEHVEAAEEAPLPPPRPTR